MNLLALAQEAVSEHAVEAGGQGGSPVAEVSPIVAGINHLFGGIALQIEQAIMPTIYGLFGAHWTPPPADEAIPEHVIFAFIAFLVCTFGLRLLAGKLSVDNPGKGQQILEVFIGNVRDTLDEVVGPYGRRYLPVVCAFAFFILIANLFGIIPMFEAPTANFNVTLTLGLCSFAYYISRGFKQQGLGYLKHFTGGIGGYLAPFAALIFCVEIVSNCLRPVTLGVRLCLNMFADHTIGGIIAGLKPGVTEWLVPILLPIPLAVFVSLVQTLVFVMLSMVYLSETVPHEEHDHDEHGEHASHAEALAAHGH